MENMETRHISTKAIRVLPRIRKGAEGISELAGDIRERGLINPITVMEDEQGVYTLIAGLRRLEAIRQLGQDAVRATVVSPMDAEELLRMEFAENEHRQGFTVSERLEYAEKIRAIEEAKAQERKSIYAREGRNEDMDARPYPEKGTTRDVVAKRVGFGSGRQYERAMNVAVNRPDLMEKVDQGHLSVFAAYKETVAEGKTESENTSEAEDSVTRKPSAPLPNDQVARARHERLMKNPLYAELREKYAEAVRDANLARRDRDFTIEGYDKRIRGYDENIDYMRRKIDTLMAENAELRRRLRLSPDEEIIVQK